MPNELKPCPFCGGEAKVEESYFQQNVCVSMLIACWRCGTTFYLSQGYCSNAIDVWNRRSDNA